MEAFVIAVDGAHLSGPGPCDDEVTGDIAFVLNELALIIDQCWLNTEEWAGGGSGL